MAKFKPGDIVYCTRKKLIGTVTYQNKNSPSYFTTEVRFDDHEDSYDKNGALYLGSPPSLRYATKLERLMYGDKHEKKD